MSEFGEVTGRDPGFAPAYAGLADVYIAARDYAAMPDSIAFPNADAAARASLAIDPNSADAYRVLGFVDYWYHHDIRAAREHFERALQIQPNSAQTHLWFGSTLLAIGAYDESLRELRIARMQEPGSKVIEMFCAWALWLRGPGDPGLADLENMAAHGAPNLIHRLLADIYLSKGDVARFLNENDQLASLQDDPNTSAYVAAEHAAYNRGGAAALMDLIANKPRLAGLNGLSAADISATLLSLNGRRDQLSAVVNRAVAAGEYWSTWRRDQIRFSKWRGDPVLMNALARVSRSRAQ
jgi:tetratricopeptide (TPR) repeat protein